MNLTETLQKVASFWRRPASTPEAKLAKYLGVLGVVALLMIGLGYIPATLYWYGQPALGWMLGGYLTVFVVVAGLLYWFDTEALVGGPFEVIEILGEGSFGTVCVARVRHDPLHRKVALKVLKPAYAEDAKILNRTRDEARLLSRLNHPNIVRVERLMEVGGRAVVVMELVEGVSLEELLEDSRSGLPPAVALEVARQALVALDVAHEHASDGDRPLRVIHRDIKPSNIMLSTGGVVKVVDFGIAKGDFEGREAETVSVVMGSRPYMAPERLDGVGDSPAVDVYSMGLTLFELLTGRSLNLSINPVHHADALERQLRFLELEGLGEDDVERLRELLRTMCAYSRIHRPPAGHCASELRQLLDRAGASFRQPLGDYARDQVVRLVRQRVPYKPEVYVQRSGADRFLKDMRGTVVGATAELPQAVSRYASVALVALLVAMVTIATDVVLKVGAFAGSGLVRGEARVNVWIPAGTVADFGDLSLDAPGAVHLPQGPVTLELRHRDGRHDLCAFEASWGDEVRYVVGEEGRPSISINDGAARACTQL